ncbi:MAG TPA: hypothetical protein VFU16_11930 [Solirubrobacterales bacterium]|nr:hypothetical protein [Solirubrobacterales bacterium]
MKAEIELRLESGEVRNYIWVVTPEEAASLREEKGDVSRIDAEIEIFDRLVVADKLDNVGVIEFYLKGLGPSQQASPAEQIPPSNAGVRGCRSVLSIAAATLPPNIREETLDEWIDELECAADENRPVLRRAVSILVRSLPILAWRSRLPSRARKPGSQ